ncbi:MAG TPA: DUF6691 family protein [Bacteroidia bacterium]|jgi:uncharacterized membrane protein YedE/YeeE|nr:DUF6691 family protein [Bacteroidia bacterium]
MKNIRYFLAGIIFGIILIKSEVISWFRIQEMFHFRSFHMYGTILSAIATGMLSLFIIRKMKLKTIDGEPIVVEPKKFTWGNVIGGLIFGLGWALTGACPGPLYALTGAGVYVMAVVLLAAVAGTWVYGLIKEKLPH